MKTLVKPTTSLSNLFNNLKHFLFKKYGNNQIFLLPNLMGEDEFIVSNGIGHGIPFGYIKKVNGNWTLTFDESTFEMFVKKDEVEVS